MLINAHAFELIVHFYVRPALCVLDFLQNYDTLYYNEILASSNPFPQICIRTIVENIRITKSFFNSFGLHRF